MNRQVARTCWLVSFVLCMVSACDSPAREKAGKPGRQLAGQGFGPVVAGSFYPGDAGALRDMVAGFLSKAEPGKPAGRIIGLLEPHAGYIYSGPVAAYGYKLLQGAKYDRVVVMAPSHHKYAEHVGVLDVDYYSIPTGRVVLDRKACKALTAASKVFEVDESLFSREHAMEVELPFLEQVMPGVKVVPLVFGSPNASLAKEAAEVLVKTFPGGRTLFIASSDLSHYHTYDHAVKEDKATLDLVKSLAVDQLARMWRTRERELCGVGPVLTLMNITKALGGKASIVYYANSGDTQGDKSRVVGYGVVAFTK